MILGLIEHDRGVCHEESLAMLTLGRRLATELSAPLHAVIIGDEATGLADELSAYGVTTVYLAQDDRLDDYAPDAWAKSVVEVMTMEKPHAVLAAGTERSNEVMARVAARTNLPLAANCTEVEPKDDAYFVTRVRWGGTVLEEAQLRGEPKLLTIAELAVEAEASSVDTPPEIVVVVPNLTDDDLRVRVVRRIIPESEGVSLTDAPVVVAGGRGVGSREGFANLDELAGLLGGAVGCSRVVTNNGWRAHADQVGQTGARVAPELYIACGISGASQHMAGCAGANHLLAINSDPEAPILAKADYAIIGDLHEVLPAISVAVRARQG